MADLGTLTDEERAFYATLPEHLGKVRMARLVTLVDGLTKRLAAAEEARSDEWDARVAAEARCAELEAEVERLRALIEQNAREALVMPVQDLRDRLAAANALLERCVTALESLGWGLDLCQPATDVRAFLANQPAAPSGRASRD